jgi:hypothetical protein
VADTEPNGGRISEAKEEAASFKVKAVKKNHEEGCSERVGPNQMPKTVHITVPSMIHFGLARRKGPGEA